MCSSTLEGEPRPVREDSPVTEIPIADHLDVVRAHHRFRNVMRDGQAWDLSHLAPFAFRVDPGLGFEVTVVVAFSCHCFTRSIARDGRRRGEIPHTELFDDGREVRVLCERRYELSKRHLPELIRELRKRTIRIARDNPQNFVTTEQIEGPDTPERQYVVFFEVTRDSKRKGRLLLQVQSAYAVDVSAHERFRPRRRVAFFNLLKTTSLRRKISG
ncbi:hypothetical protein ACFJIX_03500 [Roseateles sp. UC29_93]|jgi:hypothetical protein|uniref:hypothetical protein n=1 Tax=Roseateles sp. UC29_93 TaxID=3350177 RepID=UPI00366EBDA7